MTPRQVSSPPFRVAFVDGVTLGKWARVWAEREPRIRLEAQRVELHDQVSVLHEDRADVCFVRLPVDRGEPGDPDHLSLIPLYREVPMVVVPLDHPATVVEEVSLAELADEHLLQDPDDVPEWRAVAVEIADGTRFPVPVMTPKEAFASAAAGAGILIVPQSIARLYDRKDLRHVPVTGVSPSQIGLAWLARREDPRIETFIGVVRGRTAYSSRGGGDQERTSRRRRSSGR